MIYDGSLLPEGIKRGNRKTTPYNLFEAITIGAADILEEGFALSGDVINWINDEELTNLTSGATNSRPRLLARINYCSERFKKNV